MIEIRRILCPIDFSEFSRRALDHAVAIARWYESTITLLHVNPLVPVAAYGPGSSGLAPVVLTAADRDDCLAQMRRFAALEPDVGVSVQFEVSEGDATTGILAEADRMGCDLLVIGTHGRSGFERLVLGSVAEKVLRKATCPVLSVPRRAADTVPAPPVLFKRILCAIDFSDCSTEALNYAMSLAQEANASLTVLHVFEPLQELPADLSFPDVGDLPRLRDYVASAEQAARARLKDAVPDTIRAYCDVQTILASGKPWREILRVAAEHGSELIVVGIHGRGAVDLLFFGSTAQHVVRQATCPVLTLRKG